MSWIKSYLSGRFVYVSLNHSTSIPSTSTYGVPQGSILGPLLFILYVSELSNIISSHNLNSSYADDSHLYVSFDQSSLINTASPVAKGGTGGPCPSAGCRVSPRSKKEEKRKKNRVTKKKEKRE